MCILNIFPARRCSSLRGAGSGSGPAAWVPVQALFAEIKLKKEFGQGDFPTSYNHSSPSTVWRRFSTTKDRIGQLRKLWSSFGKPWPSLCQAVASFGKPVKLWPVFAKFWQALAKPWQALASLGSEEPVYEPFGSELFGPEPTGSEPFGSKPSSS